MTIQRHILVGSLWAVAMRWAIRLLGLVSVAVLARVLHPEDFGIMAMSMLLVGALATFGELGVGSMVIREAHVSHADLHTAWTLRLAQQLVLAALVAALAPLAAWHFREPRVTAVVYLGALSLAINGLENIGVVLLRKELDFAADFRYQIAVKIVGVIVTIALALALRNYWALALAQPVSAIANVVVSYVVARFRPRLGLASWRRYLGFSMNMVLANIARFGYNKADVFLVGTVTNAGQMGLYNVAAELSAMPSRELTSSVGRALFPSLARHRRERRDVRAPFLQVVSSVAALCLPIGLGLWVVADDAVAVLLGARWRDAGNLMRYLAIYGTLTSMIDIMLGHVLIVSGHERRQTVVFWVRCALLVAGALAGMPWGAEGIALGAMVSGFAMFAVGIVVLDATLGTRPSQYVAMLWRPVAASLIMAGVVNALVQVDLPVPLRLLACVAQGALTYVAALLALWQLAGRPAGVERSMLEALARLRARRD